MRWVGRLTAPPNASSPSNTGQNGWIPKAPPFGGGVQGAKPPGGFQGSALTFPFASLDCPNPTQRPGAWLPKQKTLHLCAAVHPQKLQLRLGFDTLGGHLQPQRLAHANDRAHDRIDLRRGVPRSPNEALVDFDPVDPAARADKNQVRVAGAEIIQRDGDAKLFQRATARSTCPAGIVDQHALGELQFQSVTRQVGGGPGRPAPFPPDRPGGTVPATD